MNTRHINAVAIRLIDNAAKWAAMTPEQQRVMVEAEAYYCALHAEARRMVTAGEYGQGKYTGEKVTP